jgi:hypothetical protein
MLSSDCATRLSTVLSMAHVLAHRSRYKRAPRPCESAPRMRFESAYAFVRLPKPFSHASPQGSSCMRCSRYVQAHTTLPSLRMSRVERALSVRVRIRTHMQSHARMLQPSRSVVMHAHVKERARDGTVPAVTARACLHTRNARTGTHDTRCACRCFLRPGAGRTSTRSMCSVDASGARERDCGISKAPVSA